MSLVYPRGIIHPAALSFARRSGSFFWRLRNTPWLALGFVDPQFGGGTRGLQLLQQRSDIRGVDDQRPVRLTDEAIGNGAVEQRQQRIVVACHVEQATGLAVDAELRPRDGFEKLLKSSVAAGSAMKASARSAISVFRSCMERTTRSSVRPRCAISRVTIASGMTPMASPPAARTASASTPISPTLPPPKTTPSPRSASLRPSSWAASTYAGREPTLEPQKTQMRWSLIRIRLH